MKCNPSWLVILVLGLLSLLPAVADDAPVSYRLAHPNERVVIESSDGRVIPWPCYLSLHESRMEHWAPKQQSLIDAGVRLGVTCVETLFEGGVIGDARVVTNSTKLRAYAPALFFPDDELLDIIVSGEIGA